MLLFDIGNTCCLWKCGITTGNRWRMSHPHPGESWRRRSACIGLAILMWPRLLRPPPHQILTMLRNRPVTHMQEHHMRLVSQATPFFMHSHRACHLPNTCATRSIVDATKATIVILRSDRLQNSVDLKDEPTVWSQEQRSKTNTQQRDIKCQKRRI